MLEAPQIAPVAVELLQQHLVIPRAATTVPSEAFDAPSGPTTSVRVRAPRTGKVQATPTGSLSYDPIDEVNVPLSVVRVFDGTRVDQWSATMTVESYATQVTAPQVAAVASQCETICAGLFNDLDVVTSVSSDPDEREAYSGLLDVRAFMSEAGVPPGERFLICSPSFANLLLEDDRVARVDASGSPSGFRDAVVGRVAGFTAIESAAIDAGTAIAMHRSGLVVAAKAPAEPQGATSAAVANSEGLSLQVVHDWDPTTGEDISLLSCLFAAGLVYEDGEDATELTRVVKLGMSTSSG